MALHVLEHPLAGHYLAALRDKTTTPDAYRGLCRRLTTLLAIEATRGIATREGQVETPLTTARAQFLGQPLAVVPVLRAGLGMLEPIVDLFPDVAVGYIGLERHEDTAIARSYYSKLPHLSGKYVLCVDPMLATGGSAAQAVSLIKANGGESVVMVCVIAAPEGVEKLLESHPGIDIYAAALDQGLNDRKYIVPGLGDFGDRLYGTE